ncbi:MAG: hypothetical protein Q9180_007164 [Flavoplaca navasiana]
MLIVPKNRQLHAQIEALEAEKKRLREQNQTLLDSAIPRSRNQEARVGESAKEHSPMAKRKTRPMHDGGQSSSTVSKHRPEKKVSSIPAIHQRHHTESMKKAVVVEDSQDRGDMIEDSQYPDLQRPLSPDVLDPVNYMPKVIQDLVAAPSSPLTDPPPSDAQERFEHSPTRPGRVIEDSQAQGQASQELGNHYETPSQRDIWTISESTTKTKSRSVERSVVKTNQPFLGLPPQFQGSNQVNSPNGQTKTQATQKPQGILKPASLKRTMSQQTQSESSQQTHKRQRVSSQASTGKPHHGLARTSPVKTAKLSQRKTKQSDKYADKFTAELAKDKK